MKSRLFLFLSVVLVLFTSLAVVGCGNDNSNVGSTKFTVSGLTFSANPAEANTAVIISATVKNNGDASANYEAKLNVSGTVIESKVIESIDARSNKMITFTYTPTAEGSFNVTIGEAAGTLVVNKQTTGGYWDIKYNIVDGSTVTFNYSLAKSTAKYKVATLSKGDGTVTIRVNRTVVNGAREITLLSSGWQMKGIDVKDVSPSVDMNVVISLLQDAKGVLYVEAGKGNVDMSSSSSLTTNPKQTDTLASGNKAPAGSMLVKANLLGAATTSVGKDIPLPFGLTFTTGNSTNVVSMARSKFDKATLSSQGVPFAKDGGVAPYVGTAGTITTTGTGDCIGLNLVTFDIDFQAEIKLVLEPIK